MLNFLKRRKREKAAEITKDNFKKTIEENNISMIFFEAPWCGACKMLHPILNELADENRDLENFNLSVVNTDSERELSQEFSIRTLPTLIVFENQKISFQGSGMISKPRLQEMIDNLNKKNDSK